MTDDILLGFGGAQALVGKSVDHPTSERAQIFQCGLFRSPFHAGHVE